MDLLKLFQEAKKSIIIIGVLPVEEFLIENSKSIADLVRKNDNLKITILHESESMLFSRSIYLDSRFNNTARTSFKELKNRISRILRLSKSFMFQDSLEEHEKYTSGKTPRIAIKQLNLWQPLQIICIDNKIYACPILINLSTVEDYLEVTDDKIKNELNSFIEYVTNEKQGGVYQSDETDEMIKIYDREDIPRGIFPRRAFYNTDFQRHSVWILIFNRSGKLLIHKRNKEKGKVKDNAGLWDKSAGGHVDLKDRSSTDTAERELVEEMYLSDAEYTKYVKQETRELINLGEWVPQKREEEQVFNIFKRLGRDDYGYFFLRPSIKRTSKRMFITWDDSGKPLKIETKETKFISDIYLFLAPEKEIQSKEALLELKSSAAEGHELLEVRELLDQIEDAKAKGTESITYTDDLLFIADEFKETLLGFADNIKQVFQK